MHLRVTVLGKCHGAESISAREAHGGSHGQQGEGPSHRPASQREKVEVDFPA